jgi:hypothetical protein
MLFKNSVRTSKRTPHFTITKINLLMLLKDVIAIYIETHKRPINTEVGEVGGEVGEVGGTYSCHSASKG